MDRLKGSSASSLFPPCGLPFRKVPNPFGTAPAYAYVPVEAPDFAHAPLFCFRIRSQAMWVCDPVGRGFTITEYQKERLFQQRVYLKASMPYPSFPRSLVLSLAQMKNAISSQNTKHR